MLVREVGIPLVRLTLVSLLVGCTASESPAADLRGELGDSVSDVTADTPEVCSSTVTLGDPVFVVPSPGLPAGLEVGQANNNLDVVVHDGRHYLAFRSAASHFASPDTWLYVVSSADKSNWDFEVTLQLGADIREPRFLSMDDQLLLFYAVLGENPMDFEPKGMMVTSHSEEGGWRDPEWAYLEGFIPWRARVVNDVPQLIGYVGGEDIYDTGESGLQVHWLKVGGAHDFTPMVPDQPVVLSGGVSETDIAILPDGGLAAVARNENGDGDGYGSKICSAPAESKGQWTCAHDPRKYDSPLIFVQGSRILLVGRRNVTETGNFDLGRTDLPAAERFLAYQLDYWETPKRCALWDVDPSTLEVSHIVDLPSAGDVSSALV